MDFNDASISPELREAAKSCSSPEELLALAKKEGYKLSEQDLEVVSGGGGWTTSGGSCPRDTIKFGDTREDIDSSLAHADFVNGLVDGGEID